MTNNLAEKRRGVSEWANLGQVVVKSSLNYTVFLKETVMKERRWRSGLSSINQVDLWESGGPAARAESSGDNWH